MSTLLKSIFMLCLAGVLLSAWQKDVFHDDLVLSEGLAKVPQQIAVEQAPFQVSQGGVSYRVEPLYRYAIEGIVVSLQHHDGDRMLHRTWNDHLNVADLCVVWGHNASHVDLSEFDFWNGQFTCFFQTNSNSAWASFRPDQLSNNHLLSDDEWVRDRIEDLRIGDQVRLNGYLARYSHDGGFKRGTSTTRSDTGNGACETLYVEDVWITARMNEGWHLMYASGWWGALGSALFWLWGVMSGKIR